MVFSSLLGDRSHAPKIRRRASSSRPAAATVTPDDTIPPEYLHDESQLRDAPPPPPDLRELNASLAALAAVFPDVQPDVFREMLASFDGESRLALVADALLKNRVAWVKGRWRVAEAPDDAGAGAGDRPKRGGQVGGPAVVLVSPADTFRAAEYKDAVGRLARYEFRGLPRSTITAVLAEHNYAYLDARRTLVSLSEKSWRYTLSSLFRRKAPSPAPAAAAAAADAQNHPLVTWKSTGRGAIVPTIRRTGNDELDAELFNTLVRPLRERARHEQEERDKELAQFLNNEEAAELDATHECGCCFTDGAFEEFTSCDAEGHLLCLRCVQHALSEAVFGQGWLSVDEAAGALRCLAVDGDGCPGRVGAEHLRRAALDMPKGEDVLRRFDQRLAEQSLLAANVPLLRCPFCDYAEVDELYLPPGATALRLRLTNIVNLAFLILCVGTIPFVLPTLILATVACLLLSPTTQPGPYLATEWRAALQRHHRRRRGQKFTCLSPQCSRASCLSCQKQWADVHVCNESSLVSLRTQVEQAMSAAVKRVCPRCATSFVKSSGCNKLRCPCGYRMCYVCRADISEVGYRHFCDHFRPEGDARACGECSRCNLWETEDTEALLREAKEEVERRWVEGEGKELSGAERAFLETGVKRAGNEKTWKSWTVPSLPEALDLLIETLFY